MKSTLTLCVTALSCLASSAIGQTVEERNRDLVLDFVAAVNERELDRLSEFVSDDVVRHSPSTPGLTIQDLDSFRQFLEADIASVPDSRQTIRRIVTEEDLVAVWATYEGTQTGPMGPFPPSGKTVSADFAGILRIEGGKIAEIWVVWDNLSMLAQLGHIRVPGVPAGVESD